MSFDPNEGAGFWWANGLNTFTRNVSVENDEYGYRYDMQKRSNFDPTLPIRQPDGSEKMVDVRQIPIWRFEDNEAHAEGFNISGSAATHLRNIVVQRPEQFKDRWPLVNRGVGTRVPPITNGVPIFIHDHYGLGRHAKVVSIAAKDLMEDGHPYREEPGLTSHESRVTEVSDVAWPELLNPRDDLPPATVVTSVRSHLAKLVVAGVTHDNGEIVSLRVNGLEAKLINSSSGVVHWSLEMPVPIDGRLTAVATDAASNVEQNGHTWLFVTHNLAIAP